MIQSKVFAGEGTIEQGALDQFHGALVLPFVDAGALMPDAHQGYSLPIGAVVLTANKLVPSWVGYDIGCGMLAVPTTFDPQTVEERRQEIYDEILALVPTGFRHHSQHQFSHLQKFGWKLSGIGEEAFQRRGGWRHLGTLGGGNHFIEIGISDEGSRDTSHDDRVWVIVHSGSRGPGHGVASAWMAHAACEPKAVEGHYALDARTPQGQAYLNDHDHLAAFALENRQLMAGSVMDALDGVCDGEGWPLWAEAINKNHNVVVPLGSNGTASQWIHRKGATSALPGELGVIPGNMKDGSYIIIGSGSPENLWSTSHGAGRVMGRNEAKRTLALDTFQAEMASAGVTGRFDESTLDESAGAYKDIHEVVAWQKREGMLDVVCHVTPLVNVKG